MVDDHEVCLLDPFKEEAKALYRALEDNIQNAILGVGDEDGKVIFPYCLRFEN